MTTDMRLRTKIQLLFLGLIVVSSILTIGAVLIATNKNVENQARDSLAVGQKVFEELLEVRSSQLFESAEVLMSDFGFKSAVLGDDPSTIESVLDNHGARIGADIMMLASLEGDLVASTSGSADSGTFSLKSLLKKAELQGGLSSTLMYDGRPYQMIILPVRAPVISAWTVIGFEIDREMAGQLKTLTSLEVAFSGVDTMGRQFSISTFEPNNQNTLPIVTSRDGAWQKLNYMEEEYLALVTPLVNSATHTVNAVLSTSLDQALSSFAQLKIQMLLIAIVALIVSAIAAVAIARNITRPVGALVGAAERISNGDYSVKISDEGYRHNELAKLANSLGQMQEGIADREARIKYQLFHDRLTGLDNRLSVKNGIEKLISKGEYGVTFGLLHINIRHFKQVNDSFGYGVGDQVLIELSKRLVSLISSRDITARLGADEFLVVLCGGSSDSLESRARELVQALQGAYQIEDIQFPITLASGFSRFPEHGNETDELFRRADIALNGAYTDKTFFRAYQSGEDEKHLEQLRLVNDLKRAIADDELVVYFQPKLDLHQRKVTQVESLVRWIHPELGFIRPDEFIGLAEQSGLMPALTRWVIHNSLLEISMWRSKDLDLKVAVNLSAYDLANDDLPSYVEATLAKFGLAPDTLILEITESAMMDNPEQAVRILNALRDAGIKLSVDDYGTGYSSLSKLKDLPVDELKIDMSFVLKLDQSHYDQAIVKSTIDMAHKLGLTVVAEGVENYPSWKYLEAWGCDKLQGYYICKPLPGDAFVDWYGSYSIPDGDEVDSGDLKAG